jgi:hypothetical protein
MSHVMGKAQPAPEIRARIINAADAEALVANTLDALDRLQPLVDRETQSLREGRITDALALADAKAEAGKRYTALIDALKSNAIAMGRFRPPGLELLKQRHHAFSDMLALNAAVLTTARTVSESIIRELSAEIGGSTSPQGYGARGHAVGAYTGYGRALSVSKTL